MSARPGFDFRRGTHTLAAVRPLHILLATVVAVARQTVRGLRVFGIPCKCKQGDPAGTHEHERSSRVCTGSLTETATRSELLLAGAIGSQRLNFTWSHPIACMVLSD